MPPFPDRCPTELLAAVLGSCASLGDLKALLLTCRRVHGVWLAHAPLVIAAVGPAAVVAFDAALVAVRATALVHEAEVAGEPPPAVDPRTLDMGARPPSTGELSALADLSRLVDCVQARYCGMFTASQRAEEAYYAPQGRWPADRPRDGDKPAEPEEPEGMPQWTERFRRAAYTALALGALLARPYQEPFVRRPGAGKEDGEEWRGRVVGRLGQWHHDHEWSEFDPEEVAYLCRFPVFDFIDAGGRHRAAFGHVARWLVGSTLERIRRGPPATECPSRSLPWPRAHWKGEYDEEEDDDWIGGATRPVADLFDEFPDGSRAEAEGVLWVLMQAVHMFEFLLDSVADDDTAPSLGRDVDADPEEPSPLFGPARHTANVVFLGIFRAETVTLFADPSTATRGRLRARLAAPSPGPRHRHGFADVAGALVRVYCRGGVPNVLGDAEAPPPPLQFFAHVLRAHFGLRFRPDTFEVTRETPRQPYREFRARASILANHFDDVPPRAWYSAERGVERRLVDVTNGTEILDKYAPAEPRFRPMVCDPRAFDTFDFFRQLGIYDEEDEPDEDEEDEEE